MKIGGIKKLGRVHNCCGGCEVIGEHNTEENFLKIFDVTGNYTVENVEGYWGGLDSINDNDGYHSGHDDTIVFNGSCTLELIDDRAMYTRDNWAMTLDAVVQLSGSQSEEIVETLTFQVDSNTIVNTFTYIVANGDRTFEITVNGNVVYRYVFGDENRINVQYSDSFVNGHTFFLIPRDNGALGYYISVPNIGFILICLIPAVIFRPVEMTYSFNTAQSGTTVTFAPNCFHLWKPDRWWRTLACAAYAKPVLQNNDGFETCFNNLCNDAVENQGCESPYSLQNTARNVLNNELAFQALNPGIRMRLSGFKGYTGQISPDTSNASVFSGYWWTVDRSTPSGSTIDRGDITVDDIPGLRAALNNGTANINSYIESHAQTLESQGKCYNLTWQNGGTATLDYTNLTTASLRSLYGQQTIKFQETSPATVLHAYVCTYPDTTVPYFPYVESHNSNELHGEWEYDIYSENWNYRTWGYTDGKSFTTPVRYIPDGTTTTPNDQCYITAELDFNQAIIALPVQRKISRNGTLTLTFQDTYNITKNNGIGKTSRLEYGHQVKGLQITQQPAHGNCTVQTSYYPYTIVYQANAESKTSVDMFEYQLTDQFGATSKNIVTIIYDDTEGNKTVENPANIDEYGSSWFNKNYTGYSYDYWIIVRVTLTIVGMGKVELFAPLNKKTPGEIDLRRVVARYIKTLDIELDEDNNPIRQLYSLDGQAQDELVARFTSSVNTITHQNNFAFADEITGETYRNVDYITVNVKTYQRTAYTGIPEDDYTFLEDVECIMRPPHDYTNGNEIGVLGRGGSIYYSGSFDYSFNADGSEHTSSPQLSLTSQINNTLPYCINFDKNIQTDPSSYNYLGGYKIISLVVTYEDGSTRTVNDW